MSYVRFALFNVVGGVTWILVFLIAGRLFGEVPFVKKNFELVAVAIVAISVLPIVVEFLRIRLGTPHEKPATVGDEVDARSV